MTDYKNIFNCLAIIKQEHKCQKMTVKELRGLCEDEDIDWKWKWRKDDLVEKCCVEPYEKRRSKEK